MYIDVRYVILLAINMFKYGVGMSWVWDPFHTINLTWINACLLSILFLAFAFIAVKLHVPLTRTTPTTTTITTTTTTAEGTSTHVVHLEFGELSPPRAVVLLVVAVIFPRALFWYAFPIIVFTPYCFGELKRFANWSYTVLTTIPVLNVIMSTATFVGWQALGPETDQGNTQALGMNLGGDAIDDLEAAELI